MKQIQALFALALLLFAGLNCGTENLINETGDTPTKETISIGMLRGEVQSIEDVAIQVRLLKAGQLVAQTEAEGSYELEAIEAGDYTLHISAKGYQTTELNVTVIAGQSVSLDKVALVALKAPVSHLRGLLTDAAIGAPLSQVRLQLTDKAGVHYEALTTDAGVFMFENLPVAQAFTLTIVHAGYEDTEVAVEPIPVSETFELDIELTPRPQAEKLEPGEGLSIGGKAPEFALPDGDGKLHALADYVGNKKVVLVFYRGGW